MYVREPAEARDRKQPPLSVKLPGRTIHSLRSGRVTAHLVLAHSDLLERGVEDACLRLVYRVDRALFEHVVVCAAAYGRKVRVRFAFSLQVRGTLFE